MHLGQVLDDLHRFTRQFLVVTGGLRRGVDRSRQAVERLAHALNAFVAGVERLLEQILELKPCD